jgi:AP-3 complex subunit delta-1
VAEIGVAIDGLASILNSQLAADLFKDVLTLLSHSKPYIRKKASLLLFRIFIQYPEALRVAYPKIREKLDDSDDG